MPPRLNPQGYPVGRRRRPTGAVRVYWCSCDSCAKEVTFHPLTQKFVKGCTLGYKEYLRHSKLQRGKQGPSSISSASSSLSGTNSPDTPPQSPPSPASVANNMRLREIETDLCRWKATMLSPLKNLVFVDPPSPTSEAQSPPLEPFSRDEPDNDLNSGPYALSFERQANRPVLEYLLNLHDTLFELDGMALSDSESLRRKRKALIDDIEGEFSRVERAKAEEWERQKAGQEQARSIWRKRNIVVVDTGELFCRQKLKDTNSNQFMYCSQVSAPPPSFRASYNICYLPYSSCPFYNRRDVHGRLHILTDWNASRHGARVVIIWRRFSGSAQLHLARYTIEASRYHPTTRYQA